MNDISSEYIITQFSILKYSVKKRMVSPLMRFITNKIHIRSIIFIIRALQDAKICYALRVLMFQYFALNIIRTYITNLLYVF